VRNRFGRSLVGPASAASIRRRFTLDKSSDGLPADY
jgi:hypothetical protein